MTIRPPAFEFHNGRTARSAQDLLTILEEGPVDLWSDHVVHSNSHRHARNDFASWVEHGLHERVLAERIRKAHTRDELLTVLREWLEPERARMAQHQRQGVRTSDFFIGLGIGIVIGIVVTQIAYIVFV